MQSKETQELIFQEAVRWRRAFHQYPELSLKEDHTRGLIVGALQEMGLEPQTFQNHNGVCAIIKGQPGSAVIGVRADMDALPMDEKTDCEFKSHIPGVMHACGHDAHMAIALGVAKTLSLSRENWRGAVKMIFQPAEELAPTGGAHLVMADGVLENPKVDAIFGLHVWPDVPFGAIGIRLGGLMGSSDRLTIEVKGLASHAGEPHKGVDAISVAADIVKGMQQIMSRQKNPVESGTISIGTIHGGERYNVVAGKVVMEGTVRSHNEALRQSLPGKITRMAEGIARAFGAEAKVDYRPGFPVLSISKELFNVVVDAATEAIGRDNVLTDVNPSLGAEDFANYLTKIPGAFFWLGCQSAEQKYPIHNPKFNIDENALKVGIQVMTAVVSNALVKYNRG